MLLRFLIAYDAHRLVPGRLFCSKQVPIDLMLHLMDSCRSFVLGCVLSVPTVEAGLILWIADLAVSNASNLLLRLKIVLLWWNLRHLSVQ